MTGRVSLGSRKIYLSVLGSGFGSSCGDSTDGSIGSLSRPGKGSYLIVHDENCRSWVNLVKCSVHVCNCHTQTH